MKKINRVYLIFLVFFLAIFYLFVENQFYKSIIIYIMINAMNASMLNLLFGYGGVVSLGQAAFFGIGAYTTGILTVHFGFEPFSTIFLGMLILFICWLFW